MRASKFRTVSAAIAAWTIAGAVAFVAPAPVSAETVTTTKTTTTPMGTMTVVSEEKRTFRVGDTQVIYTAPPTVDLHALQGANVRVEVAPSGEVSRVTRVESTTTTVDED
jgi:hypothetical protein